MTAAQLAEHANKEGSLTLYSPLSSEATSGLAKAFQEKYPKIKLHALTLDTTTLLSRVTTEQRAGTYNADVITANSLYMYELLNAGALAPYTPSDLPPAPSGLDLPKGYQSLSYLITNVIAYNPKLLERKGLTPPKTFADLTAPGWRKNFSMAPNGVDFYQGLKAAMGADKALILLKQLGDNDPQLVVSHSQAVAQVQAGTIAGTISYGVYAAKAARSTPDSLQFVNTNPLGTAFSMIDLAKNAPHPAAARLFLNWFESTEGQRAMVAATGFTSLRDGVGNDSTVWDPAKWPPAFTPLESIDQYNKTLAEYKDAIHAR